MHKYSVAGLAGGLLLAVAAGQAALAASWKFDLANESEARVTSFKTYENGVWSENWLKVQINPGETYEMDFGTDEGTCSVRTRIWFSDQTHVDGDIDYCNMNTITVSADGISWE